MVTDINLRVSKNTNSRGVLVALRPSQSSSTVSKRRIAQRSVLTTTRSPQTGLLPTATSIVNSRNTNWTHLWRLRPKCQLHPDDCPSGDLVSSILLVNASFDEECLLKTSNERQDPAHILDGMVPTSGEEPEVLRFPTAAIVSFPSARMFRGIPIWISLGTERNRHFCIPQSKKIRHKKQKQYTSKK